METLRRSSSSQLRSSGARSSQPVSCSSRAPVTASRRGVLLGSISAAAAPALHMAAAALPAAATVREVEFETDKNGLNRVKYHKEGYRFWDWRGHRVHYIEAGNPAGQPVLLVHGYGASAYHYRYTIAALADAGYHVFSVCMLGFGWSEKANVDYSRGATWSQQLRDFVQQVVHTSRGDNQRVTIAGNSLGGYAAMAAVAAQPELFRGVVLLNSAGPMTDPLKQGLDPSIPRSIYQPLVDTAMDMGKRVVLWFAFNRAKQPERIREVLEMVYVSKDNIDDDLVDSIVQPVSDPNAGYVFYLINKSSSGPPLTVNQLLGKMRAVGMPIMLLWGDLDPWMTPRKAAQIMALYPEATLKGLQSGHCPHDDTPAATNIALLDWLKDLPSQPTAAAAGAAMVSK